MKTPAYYFRLFLIFLMCYQPMHTHGQNVKTYASQWKIVADFQKKNLPKSALEEVKRIYDLAKKENQDAQVVKSTIYMINLQVETREDQALKSIAELENEVSASKEPAKSILTNLLASTYYAYYQSVRWQIYERTATVNFKKEDVSTWTTEDFHQKISELYLSSISNEKLLKQTKLDDYEAIITKGNTRKLRPTLYDLLTNKALQYFSSDERNVKKPSYAFEIDQAAAFDPAADFIHRKFTTKDSTSLEFFALQLYQKLVAFHIEDDKPDALIDIDLQRLQFVRQKSVHPDKDTLYYMSVNHLADQYQQTPAAAQAWFLTAAFHDQQGNTYKADGDTTHRFEKAKAVAICEKIVKENPDTEGGINAFNLLNTLKNKNLQFTTEQVNVPDKPFLTLVEFRNIPSLSLRIVKATDELKQSIAHYNDIKEPFQMLAKAPAMRNWKLELPDTKDFQQHSLEIKIDALPIGEYILLASSDDQFSNRNGVSGFQLFYVSNIGHIQREQDYFILDRDSGQPLAGANVTIWKSMYDYKVRRNVKFKGASYIADKDGHFKEKRTEKKYGPRVEMLEITFGKDRLFIQEANSSFYTNDDPEDAVKHKTYLFTDRSLYRPGQTVYYKGIVAAGKKVLEDQTKKIEIALENMNGEIVEKATKTVNEFGSFSGTFVLPQTGLNGQFSLVADKDEEVFFHVEEYKRPRFAVQFDTLRESYKLEDTIQVTGLATAYAGNQIDGAKVTFRVVRNERFLYPWFYKSRYFPTSEPQEIAHGETVTDASGKFQVRFKAIPNLKTNKQIEPVFDFTVYADVTDINGETRSAETAISIGYKSIILKTEIPETIPTDSLASLKIRTENMNGTFVSSPVAVKISRLIAEKRLIRPRYWPHPDLFLMSKPEFIAAFPHDEYDRETEKESWPEQGVIFQKTAQTDEKEPFLIGKVGFTAGFYKIELTAKDESNAEIKDVKFIELTDPKSKELTSPQYIQGYGSSPIQPGEKTKVGLATSAEQVFVISSSGKEANPDNFTFFKLNTERRSFNVTATEADRGGFGIDYMFVKHNRVHQFQDFVSVPWTNKELNIEYQTFRDKTLPGSKEKWTVKISGYKKDKVAAELLASMYDASLDQFYPHQWAKPAHWPIAFGISRWNNGPSFTPKDALILDLTYYNYKNLEKTYDELLSTWIMSGGYPRGSRGGNSDLRRMLARTQTGLRVEKKNDMEVEEMSAAAPQMSIGQDAAELNRVVTVGYGVQKATQSKNEAVQTRKNFNETAFFIPDLQTDKDGSITFSFTMPEALTRWKFQALAHTKDLALGYSSKEIVTQKELMVQPNPPRFLREGDQISMATKVVNLSDHALSGKVSLELFDSESNEPINVQFGNDGHAKDFDVAAGQSLATQFAIKIPTRFAKAINWRIVAKAGNLSDGEENTLPVLSNRILVTETLPLTMRGSGTKQFKMDKLINSANSKTLTNQALTIEYTSNPAWYAVQALPYLMEYPHECAEQTWNRYYANSIAANIVASSSRIAKIFETWRKSDTTALLSNLQKNQELKSLILEETPWVLAAKTESEQKKNIALLFDLLRMTNELTSTIEKLKQLQNPGGSFSWFKGGPDDRYMTQYIASGIGHLRKTNAVQKSQEAEIASIIQAAIPYLDARIIDDYNDLIKHKTDLKEYTPSSLMIQYLYMRSFFADQSIPAASQKAHGYFTERAKATWNVQSKYMQGMIAIALHRSGDKTTPTAILKSLKEIAINNPELGMYWKTYQRSWRWQEAPIEQQALLIEAFQEISNDTVAVNDMKTWLLKNKQTNNWESTKATAEACYALLMTGTNWLAEERAVAVQLNQTKLKIDKTEAGTGYFKKSLAGKDINAAMGNIEVTITGEKSSSSAPSWGAVYWQYFEDMDKVTFAETPLKLTKNLFIEKNSDKGPQLTPVNADDILHVGDKVKVRITLHVDRDMEYVHMKDMRASAFEPVNVLSSFKWQDGLGYYESTKDASTNFFFSTLRKGIYVFEYPLFINQEGNFSNGITTIQCMYAPEFTAHSEGVRVQVGK